MSALFVSFKAVKEAVSMAQVLERYGLLDTLKRHGADGLTGTCPIHKGTNPTQFRVSVSKNCWNCFGGCEGGNVLDFVMAMEGVDVRKAGLLLVEWFGIAQKPPRRGRTENPKRETGTPHAGREATPPQREAGSETSGSVAETPQSGEVEDNPPLRFEALKGLDAGHAFLRKHGFSPEAMEELGVGYCGRGLMKGRIAIPIHNGCGALVAYAGRSIIDHPALAGSERDTYPNGFHREWELFNLHRAFRARKTNGFGLLVAEDFFDVFRLFEAGYENAVALMGRGVSTRQAKLLAGAIGRKSPLTLLVDEGPGLSDLLLSLTRDFAVRFIPKRPARLSVAEVQVLLEDNT